MASCAVPFVSEIALGVVIDTKYIFLTDLIIEMTVANTVLTEIMDLCERIYDLGWFW